MHQKAHKDIKYKPSPLSCASIKNKCSGTDNDNKQEGPTYSQPSANSNSSGSFES